MKSIANKLLLILAIMGFLLGVILGGCAQTRIGKINLLDGSPPKFLKVGETNLQEVLEQIGELFGYREQGNRSAMVYVDYHEDYTFLLITEIRIEKAYRLDFVFQNEVLEKAEVKREGWGFGANIDPQLLQLLAK